MKKIIFCALLFAYQLVFAWNQVGHEMVAQVAYDNLTPETKTLMNKWNHALDVAYEPQSLVKAAVWMDQLKSHHVFTFDPWHYIDIPYSTDGSDFPPVDTVNAVWVIGKALEVLNSKSSSDFEKGFHLRVLLHLVGDIHQPLHAINRYSVAHPHGDKGGNLYKLGHNSVASNLHGYWDNGAGLFKYKSRRYRYNSIKRKASKIQKKYPAYQFNLEEDNVYQWALQSHQLAKTIAYSIEEHQKPSEAYRKKVQDTVQSQVALAGYRLAELLNSIARG
jgi:hypothetical protein